MPRVENKKKEYKLRDFKGWVIQQMRINHKTQKDVGDALGLTAARISQMLKIPDPKKDKGKRINPDPFSYGQVIALCEYFEVEEEERKKLLTL